MQCHVSSNTDLEQKGYKHLSAWCSWADGWANNRKARVEPGGNRELASPSKDCRISSCHVLAYLPQPFRGHKYGAEAVTFFSLQFLFGPRGKTQFISDLGLLEGANIPFAILVRVFYYECGLICCCYVVCNNSLCNFPIWSGLTGICTFVRQHDKNFFLWLPWLSSPSQFSEFQRKNYFCYPKVLSCMWTERIFFLTVFCMSSVGSWLLGNPLQAQHLSSSEE